MTKRIVLLTVGVTHSGKSTFARQLEQLLPHTVVLDQDLQAAFLNTYYEKLVPQTGLNTLKMQLSETLLQHAITETTYHLILCNANLLKSERQQLLDRYFPRQAFIRVLVYVHVDEVTLTNRLTTTSLDVQIFRSHTTSYEQLLHRQLTKLEVPTSDEADIVLTLQENETAQQIYDQLKRL